MPLESLGASLNRLRMFRKVAYRLDVAQAVDDHTSRARPAILSAPDTYEHWTKDTTAKGDHQHSEELDQIS